MNGERKTFSNHTVAELKEICKLMVENNIERAEQGNEKAERTVEYYDDYDQQLDLYGGLTPKQCKSIAVGCQMYRVDCPDEVVELAIEAGFRPSRSWLARRQRAQHEPEAVLAATPLRRREDEPVEITVTREDVRALATVLADKVWDELRAR